MDLQKAEQILLDNGKFCYEIDFFNGKEPVIELNELKIARIRLDLERKGINVSFHTVFEQNCRKEWLECWKLQKESEVTAERIK